MAGWDVVVVGGGVMGSAAAWQLAGRGRSVLLLEGFASGHTRGSSHGAVRMYRLGYAQPRYVRMALDALDGWRAFEAETGHTLVELTGGLDHGAIGGLADVYAAAGVTFEVLTPADAAERWPGMVVEGEAIWHQPAGRIWADRAVRAFQDRAAALGAEVCFETPVTALTTFGGGVLVRTAEDEYRARVAVLAAGAWAPTVAGPVVPLPPLTVTREQYVVLPLADRSAGGWPGFIHRIEPVRYGLVTPGEGFKLGEHGTGLVVDADRRTFDVDPVQERRLRDYASRWLPGLVPVPSAVATCLYTLTPTEDFVLDRHGPFVVAAGFSGHGFKFAPVVGRIVADLVDGDPQREARFTLAWGRRAVRARASL